jgi:hypothetical protein
MEHNAQDRETGEERGEFVWNTKTQERNIENLYIVKDTSLEYTAHLGSQGKAKSTVRKRGN